MGISDFKLNRPQYEYLTSTKPNTGFVAGLGCLPHDTEYLTPHGWKKISEYKDEEVLVYDKETGQTAFEKPQHFIKKEATYFTTYKTTQFSMTVSPEHKILYKTEHSDVLREEQEQNLKTKRIQIPRQFSAPINVKGVDLSDNDIRLLIASSADGTIAGNRIRFNFKRKDKKKRILMLLKNYDYSVICPNSCRKNGYLKISYVPTILTKDLSILWQADKRQLQIIAEECQYWDGSIDKRCGSITVSGIDKNSLDLLQYALTVTNGTTSLGISDKREYKTGAMYEVRNFTKGDGFSGLRRAEVTKDFSHNYKYCFTVSTGFFIVRQENNIFITGNSGKTFVATLKCILYKLNNPTLTVAYYLPTYGLIADICFDKFPQLLEEIGIEYRLNKSSKEIHIKGAGKIIFRSMDSPEKIVGYEVAFSIIDEADILPMAKMEVAYNKIMSRNRQKHPKGEANMLDIVGTP